MQCGNSHALMQPGRESAIDQLCRAGANLDKADSNGRTPRLVARPEYAEMLRSNPRK